MFIDQFDKVMDDVTEWKELLRSGKKLEREHGVGLLREAYLGADHSQRLSIESYISGILRSSGIRWEENQGALLAAKAILTLNCHKDSTAECTQSESGFASEVKLNALSLLEHPEYAVRITAGKCQRWQHGPYPGLAPSGV